MHDDAPPAPWKVPAEQPSHLSLRAAAALPASHATGTPVPVAHAEPAGQSAQSACERAPVVPLNVPASHGVATLAPSPHQLPTSHTSQAVAPADA